jgi:DNA-binding transcriptional regulator GbsR (MarR family)
MDIYYKNICNNRIMSASIAYSAKSSASIEQEQAILSFWIQVSDLLGYPHSVGQIFGLIFLSESPLSANDLVQSLGISRSGAGQGLKALQDIGAIKTAHQLASRKEHFQLQTDLGVFVKLLLNARVLPKLEELSQQRKAIDLAVRTNGPVHLVQRFDQLERWKGKTGPLVELLKSFSR